MHSLPKPIALTRDSNGNVSSLCSMDAYSHVLIDSQSDAVVGVEVVACVSVTSSKQMCCRTAWVWCGNGCGCGCGVDDPDDRSVDVTATRNGRMMDAMPFHSKGAAHNVSWFKVGLATRCALLGSRHST